MQLSPRQSRGDYCIIHEGCLSTKVSYNNAYLSCLDNGYCCWNAIYLERQNSIGVLPVSRCLTKIKHKYLSNIKALLTCHYLNSVVHLLLSVYKLIRNKLLFSVQQLRQRFQRVVWIQPVCNRYRIYASSEGGGSQLMKLPYPQ